MGKKAKQRFITVIAALAVTFSSLFGLLRSGTVALAAADEVPVTSHLVITTDFDGEALTAGTRFNLILNYSTTYLDTFWSSIGTSVGPLNADGTAFDLEIAKKLKVVCKSNEDGSVEDGELDVNFGSLSNRSYDTRNTCDRFVTAPLGNKDLGSFTVGIYCSSTRRALSSSESITITVPIEVTEDIEVDSVTFGVIGKVVDGKEYFLHSDILNFGVEQRPVNRFINLKLYGTDGIISVENAVIKLKPDNYLVNLDAGVSAQALETVDLTLSPASIVLDRLTSTLYVKPTFTDAAITSRIGTDKSNKVLVRHDETEPIPIPSGSTKLIIHVHYNPENTEEYQEYSIDLVFTSIRLKDINVNTGTAEMTKVGLQGEFNADKFAYSVKVPDSAPSAQITATVPETEVAEEITLSAEGCTISQTTVNSGAAFTVSEITEGATVTLTAKSTDGEITQNYRLTFGILSTDTEIKEFNIVSGELKYNNDSKKAEENACDYYFAVKEGKNYSMSITVASTSSSKYSQIDGKTDEYIVTVTAEAGNSKDYKVILSKDSGSNTAFNILKVVDFVAVESVAVDTISCFSLPLRIINIIIWDILVPIFG